MLIFIRNEYASNKSDANFKHSSYDNFTYFINVLNRINQLLS